MLKGFSDDENYSMQHTATKTSSNYTRPKIFK